MTTLTISWAERLALIEHFKPTIQESCALFAVTPDEITTAQEMAAKGTFAVSKNVDFAKYASYFKTTPAVTGAVVVPSQTTHSEPAAFAKPETATKRVAVPKKRGRKGDKIQNALLAVPTTPVDINTFMQQQGVSLAVLRQAKRFAAVHGEQFVQQVGTINVRQDKATKKLMIWKS